MHKQLFTAMLVLGAGVLLTSCSDSTLPTTPTDPPQLHRGGPPRPQAEIRRLVRQIFSCRGVERGARRSCIQRKIDAHLHMVRMFIADRKGNDDEAAAHAAELANLALVVLDENPSKEPKVTRLLELLTAFGLPSLEGPEPGPQAGIGFVTPTTGVVVTSNNQFGPGQGFFGIEIEPGQSPFAMAIIVDPNQLEGNPALCHPEDLVGEQREGCALFRTIPAMGPADEFGGAGALVGACFEGSGFADFFLFRSDGPGGTFAEELDEEPTPGFLTGFENCPVSNGSAGSNWLRYFADAGWQKLGRPLVSLLAPKPLEASVMPPGGGRGGRVKRLSNVGWAKRLPEEEPSPVIDFETLPGGAPLPTLPVALTNQFQSVGVVFSYTPVASPPGDPRICESTNHDPPPRLTNHSVSWKGTSATCGGGQLGTITMTYAGLPSEVSFILRHVLGAPTPEPTITAVGGSVVSSVASAYVPNVGGSWHEQTFTVTSTGIGISQIDVFWPGGGGILLIDNLDINP